MSLNKLLFRAHVEQHDPDIILGCESKIDGTIPSYSLFPDNFTVYRKDRDQHGGGVFVATKDKLISVDMSNLDSDCKIIWASLQFAGSKPLHIASYYGPHSNKSKAIDELSNSVTKILGKDTRHCPNIIIGGDYNLANIHWSTWTTTNPKTASVHTKFLNFLLENSFAQVQTKITRRVSNSVLDLVATTCPHLVSNVRVVPGISDHDVVLFDVNLKPKHQAKLPHKIYNYKKGDIDQLRFETKQFSNQFVASDPLQNSVDTNWQKIRDNLQSLLDKHIPSKLRSGKRHLAWITPDLKRKMRKRDRMYSLARKKPSHQSNGSLSDSIETV